MAEAPPAPEAPTSDMDVPRRAIYATFGVGFTANGVAMMLKVVVPLWAIQLQLSATQIGFAIGVSAVLPFLLSIHGGVLMDKLGIRRVTMAYALMTAVFTPLFPALPFFAAIIVLQLITGLSSNMGWVGAQALICQLSRGKTALIARFSLSGKAGTLLAPMLVGAVWDLAGAWGAFIFCGAAGLLVIGALALVPAVNEESPLRTPGRSLARELVPRLADYVGAFSLIAIPAVAFVVVMTALRISSSAVQTSFYIVYLEQLGMLGTTIGFLVGISEGGGMLGAFTAAAWERYIKPHWVFIGFGAASLFFVSITPLLGGIFVLLLSATFLRGYSQGLSQPVMFGILARAVGPTQQGTSIGLRTTANRLASIIVPAIMGVVADAVGIERSFLYIGGTLIVLCGVVALFVRRIPGFKT